MTLGSSKWQPSGYCYSQAARSVQTNYMPQAGSDNKNSHKFTFYGRIYNNYTTLNAARVLIYQIHIAYSHSTKSYRTSFRSAIDTGNWGGGVLSTIIGQEFEWETCPVARNRLNSLEKNTFRIKRPNHGQWYQKLCAYFTCIVIWGVVKKLHFSLIFFSKI